MSITFRIVLDLREVTWNNIQVFKTEEKGLSSMMFCCIIQKHRHLVMLLAVLRNGPDADYSHFYLNLFFIKICNFGHYFKNKCAALSNRYYKLVNRPKNELKQDTIDLRRERVLISLFDISMHRLWTTDVKGSAYIDLLLQGLYFAIIPTKNNS